MKFFLLVGLGGCIGSILRAGVGQLLIGFGYTTILVNLLGAFMIGFLAKYAEGFSQPDLFKAFWMIGYAVPDPRFDISTRNLPRLNDKELRSFERI